MAAKPPDIIAPPHHGEAEEAVLGSLLIDTEAIVLVSNILTPADFYSEGNAIIYATLLDFHRRQITADFVSLHETLERKGQLKQVGGASYLATLINAPATAAYAEHYARMVERASLRRRLIRMGSDLVRKAYELDDPDQIVTEAESALYDLRSKRQASQLITPADRMRRAFNRYADAQQGQRPGIDYGFRDLDRVTYGCHKGDMGLIAARPSVGKTSFASNAAENQTKAGYKVLFCTAEQPESQLTDRWVAGESGYSVHSLEQDQISESGWARINEVLGTGSTHIPYCYDDSHMTTGGIRTMATEMRSKIGLDIIYVDYLQLLHDKGGINNNERVTEISRQLKSIGRQLEVPIIICSQLNRLSEGRADKKPALSDLRDSGSLEQDADVVMLLWREDDKPSICHVILAKQRNGPRGITVDLMFDAERVRFRDLETRREYAG